MSTTRDDVARMAGVSTATVSRVFNDPESVSSARAKRVREAAQKLKYTPDKNASALRRNSTGAIMFLERSDPDPAHPDARYYAWFYADIIRAVKSVIDKSMYQLVLHSYAEVAAIQSLKSDRAADGIIAHDPGDQRVVDAVMSLKIPYVVCQQGMRCDRRTNVSYIDEVRGGFVAGEKLRETGHARPAHITGELDSVPVCRDRWAGFQQAFAGTRPVLVNGVLGIQGGYESGLQLGPLIRKRLVDGVFVVNDLTAVGVIHALIAQGIGIPREVSIIGYDNLPFIDTLPFKLTTVDIRMSDAYREGALLLLQSIRDGSQISHSVHPVVKEGESVHCRR